MTQTEGPVSALARERVHEGLKWLNKNAWGWWVYLWAYTSNHTRLVPPKELGSEFERNHLVAVAFRRISKDGSRLNWMIQKYGHITYSAIVEEFKLTPELLVAYGFEPDATVPRELLEYVWHEEIFGKFLDDLLTSEWARRKEMERPAAPQRFLH